MSIAGPCACCSVAQWISSIPASSSSASVATAGEDALAPSRQGLCPWFRIRSGIEARAASNTLLTAFPTWLLVTNALHLQLNALRRVAAARGAEFAPLLPVQLAEGADRQRMGIAVGGCQDRVDPLQDGQHSALHAAHAHDELEPMEWLNERRVARAASRLQWPDGLTNPVCGEADVAGQKRGIGLT